MDNSIDKVKSLIINGVEYAKYEIMDYMLFINVSKNIIPNQAGESENYLIQLISLIENTKIRGAAYLNI